MRLLIAEDDVGLSDTLQKAFEEEGFAVDVAHEGGEGLFKLRHTAYDVALVDIMLPGMDGLSLVKAARDSGVSTPIILVTARGAVQDRVSGLALGADDYVAKPFALAELLARVRAMVRRSYGDTEARITIGSVVIDTVARRITRDGVEVELPRKEYALLELLARARGRVLTREFLTEHLYDEDVDVESNVIDVYVASLRRKLGQEFIKTRRGRGYVVDEVETQTWES